MTLRSIIAGLGREARGYLRLAGAAVRLFVGWQLAGMGVLLRAEPDASRLEGIASLLCLAAGAGFLAFGVWTTIQGIRDLARGERWASAPAERRPGAGSADLRS